MSHTNDQYEHSTDGANTRWVRQRPPLEHVGFQTRQMTVGGLVTDTARSDHQVDAAYQRSSVWTDEKRRRLIRSIVSGVPTGAIVRSTLEPVTATDPSYRVVDGRQRLEALWAFVDGAYTVPADWFADDDLGAVPANGQITFAQLSERGQRRFENRPFSVLEFDSVTEWTNVGAGNGTHGGARQYTTRRRSDTEQLEYEAQVFVLVNTTGTPQTEGDIERAAQIAAGNTN